jgi:hypothetical protein
VADYLGRTAQDVARGGTDGMPLSRRLCEDAAALGYPGLPAAAWPEVSVDGDRKEAVVDALESHYGLPLQAGSTFNDATGQHFQWMAPPREAREARAKQTRA